MAEAKVIGVLGFPVNHSQSPEIFEGFFQNEGLIDWKYERFPFERLDDFIKYLNQRPEILGFNVTIPHKAAIIPYLDDIDESASNIGEVNTLTVSRKTNNQLFLKGYNTDYYGFMCCLDALPFIPEYAIVLGTGGASKAVCAVLRDRNISFVTVSRTPQIGSQIAYEDVELSRKKTRPLIVNTTPVGMLGFPQKHINISIETFPNSAQIIDLVYNPVQTPLLSDCKEKGLTCMNGSLMLQKQAERAWEIFKSNA